MIAQERYEAHGLRRLVTERPVAQQSLRAQGFEAIAASCAIHLIDEPIQRLGVGVRIGMLEVVQDQATPSRVPHEAEYRPERLAHFARHKLDPREVVRLRLRGRPALVEVVERLFQPDGRAQSGVNAKDAVKPIFSFVAQSRRPSGQEADVLFHRDPRFIVEISLDGLADTLDGFIGVAEDVELIDNDGRAFEEPLVQLLVRPVHILRDDADDPSLLLREGAEVVSEVRRFPVGQHVEHRPALDITDQEPWATVDDLLVHAKDAGKREGISLKALLGMFGEYASYGRFVDAIQAASVSEGPVYGVLCDLRPQTVGHVAIGAEAGDPVRQDRSARLAAIATALEAQDGRAATNGTVPDADCPQAVLIDGPAAFAARDASVFLLRIDEHTVRPFLNTSDLHPAKAKQINAVQTPTPNAERHSARATKESN